MAARERTTRRAVVAVAVWLVVVASGSWLVWTVISAAGGTFVRSDGRLPTGPTTDAAHTEAPPSRPSPARVTQTWSGPAGVVTVRCVGPRIELAGAAASADGYVVEVGERGPQRVAVEFRGRADETVAETHVVARCLSGQPEFSVSGDD